MLRHLEPGTRCVGLSLGVLLLSTPWACGWQIEERVAFYEKAFQEQARVPGLSEDYRKALLSLTKAVNIQDLEKQAAGLEEAAKLLKQAEKTEEKDVNKRDVLRDLSRCYSHAAHNAIKRAKALEGDKREKLLRESRRFFDASKNSHTGHLDHLMEALAKAKKDKSKSTRSLEARYIGTRLQLAAIERDYAKTTSDPAEIEKQLRKALKGYQDLYRRYRTRVAGLSARLGEAECHEALGEFRDAIAICDEVIAVAKMPSPSLKKLGERAKQIRDRCQKK